MNENLKKKSNEISPNKVINKNTGVGNIVYEGISPLIILQNKQLSIHTPPI